jgi:hypothetical protein
MVRRRIRGCWRVGRGAEAAAVEEQEGSWWRVRWEVMCDVVMLLDDEEGSSGGRGIIEWESGWFDGWDALRWARTDKWGVRRLLCSCYERE